MTLFEFAILRAERQEMTDDEAREALERALADEKRKPKAKASEGLSVKWGVE